VWDPADLYPAGVAGSVRIKGGPVSPGYEGSLVDNWRRDLPELAARVRIPVRYTLGEHERVWSTGTTAMAEIATLFTEAPVVLTYEQAGGGHNLSLGYIAPRYHRSVLNFVEECGADTTDLTMEAT